MTKITWYPGEDPGKKEGYQEKTSDISVKCGASSIITSPFFFLNCDECTIVMEDVNNKKTQAWGTQKFSTLSLQHSCKCKTIIRQKVYQNVNNHYQEKLNKLFLLQAFCRANINERQSPPNCGLGLSSFSHSLLCPAARFLPPGCQGQASISGQLRLTGPEAYAYITSTRRLQGGTDPVTDVNVIDSS